MGLGLYGKHPAKGDFLGAGVPPALQQVLESWLDSALGELREVLGPEWQTTWDSAPFLRFWLGEAIWGGVVAGVLAPSRDRVGRRFPLVLLSAGPEIGPPVATPDPWFDRAATFLRASLAEASAETAAEILANAPAPEGAGAPITSASFWAVKPGVDDTDLWADVTATDHRHAATARSYWWVKGENRGPETSGTPLAPRPPLWSQVWAGPGLPTGAVLAWLCRGHVGHE